MAATCSPQEVFNHHAQALEAEDLDEIVADYSDDAIFITPAGVQRDKDGIRQAFTKLLSEVPQATGTSNHHLRRRHPVPRVKRRGRRQPHRGRHRHLRLL
jgi:ketosteroid isomerase-like protein